MAFLADLVHPSPSKPNEGVVELHVDLSLCGGGGSVGGGVQVVIRVVVVVAVR